MRDFDQDDNHDHDDYFWFTGRSRLSRDMHILEGYVRGIVADCRIDDLELKQLARWISGHREFADRHPFNEVIPRIQRIIADGIVDESERADLLWLANKFSTENQYYDDVKSEMQRLQGILAGILANGVITEPELKSLQEWVDERSYLKRCWPYDELESIIGHVMRDGQIDDQEHEALVQFFGEFVLAGERKSVGVIERDVTVSRVCSMSPVIEFTARAFCFTGSSERGTKDYIKSIVLELGGAFHKNVCGDTDFLIVGAEGNPCWAFACYGRKVEEAVERQRNGQRIIIAHENDFWQAVEQTLPLSKWKSLPIPNQFVGKLAKNRRQKKEHTEQLTESIVECKAPILAGKTLVVTGTLENYTREEIESLIKKHGGRVTSSVSKSTDYLVAGEKAGSKLDKAQKLNVQVISEREFEQLIAPA